MKSILQADLSHSSAPVQAWVKLAIMSLLFGGTFIAGRMMAGEVPPALGSLLRFIIASFCLLALLFWKERRFPIPSPKEFVGLILLGLTGIAAYNLLFLTALETIEAGRTSVIIATNPIMVTIMSCLFMGDRFNQNKLLGILLSVSGASLVASKGSLESLLHFSRGDLSVLVCAFFWALYTVIGKRVLSSLSPLVSVTYSSVIGTLLLIPATLYLTDVSLISQFSVTSWLSIAYLAIFGTAIGFLFYYEGIKEIGVIKASIFINLIPISTVLLSIPLLGEIPGLSMLIGTPLVICGVFLVNRSSKTGHENS